MTLITMYDSVNPDAIPLDAKAVAGYVGGNFPSFSPIVERCPNALHKSIAVNAEEDADILDVENGDATPDQAPAWFKRQVARGVKVPGLYAPESEMVEVIAAMRGAGIKDAEWVQWDAHFDNVPSLPTVSGKLCPAKQYIDHGPEGQNYDISVCDPSFFGPTVPAVNPPHYDWMSWHGLLNGLKLNEADVAKRYDKYRAMQTPKAHPARVLLALQRLHLKWLAGRVWKVAHKQPRKDGRPSWNVDHRGWRWQQFTQRAQGARLV